MKTTEEIIDYLNKSQPNNYIEFDYNGIWSFIDQKTIKDFLKSIPKKDKIFTKTDYNNEVWYCDNLKTECNVVIFKLKKITNEYFINEFNEFEKAI